MLEVINSMCKSAGCFTVTEAKNTLLVTYPDNRTRPDIDVGGLKAVNVVLDVKITESDIKHSTMAQAKKPTRTVKEGERQRNLKFPDAVVAQGKVFSQPL
jgi:hypothetical protein